ncbi:MAG: sporulation protein YqfD [Clostridia bacterium]|nr:sporulation protein YqfD [Clostridia bacterium]
MYIGILLRLIFGYVRVEVEGYYIERFINICQNKKILIWNLKRQKGVKLYLNIGIKDFKKLKNIARKTNCKIKISKKKGIPFILHRYKKRKIFAIFLIIIAFSIYTSSKYVWNIEVQIEDNLQIEQIEEDLADLGLRKGMLKSKIETDKLINELRLKRNDISWIGIDLKGTNVIVKAVKADEKPDLLDNSDYCNIVATKSGIITKIIAQNGTAVVNVGDEVNEGDILIAGYMEGKYTDKRYVHSLGVVQAKIKYSKSEKIYLKQEKLRNTGDEEKKFQIKFNNFQINFYKTLSKFKIYDTIYTEKNLKIFSNFYLPISIVEITNKEQIKEEKTYSKEEVIELGKQKLSCEIEKDIANKENILGVTVDTDEQENYVEVCVTYEVLENIESYEKIEM